MAEGPDGHAQQIIEVAVLLVLILFFVLGGLNPIELLKPCIASVSQKTDPLSFGLDHLEPAVHDFLNKPDLVFQEVSLLFELAYEVSLSLLIPFDSFQIKLIDYLTNRFVFDDPFAGAEEMHVVELTVRNQLEVLEQFRVSWHFVEVEAYYEFNGAIAMVLLNVLNISILVLL